MRGTLMRRILVLGAFCASLSASLARTQGPSTDPVSEAIADVQELVAVLEDSRTTLSFAVRSDLLIVLQNLQQIQRQMVDGTLNRLDTTVQSGLRSLRDAIRDFSSGNMQALESVHDIGASLTEAMTRIPGFSDEPMVTTYSPTLALASPVRELDIFVHGALLGSTHPTLEFASRTCTLKEHLERSLAFRCSAPGQTSERWASGQLVLEFNGWFDYFFLERKSYRVAVRTIPQPLGQYELSPTVEVETTVRRPRSQTNGHRNPHCSGNKPVTWTYSPGAGCEIDVDSVRTRVLVRSSKSSFGGVDKLTATGFQVRGSVNNNGKCVKVLGQPASRDGRGSLRVETSWVDLCKTTTESQPEPEHGEILWGKDVSIPVPESTKAFKLEIRQTNKETRIIQGDRSGVVDKPNWPWFSVRWQPAARSVVVSPTELERAFAK